jgi:AraC family transcriptional regulator, transcriptional activator of pobA
MKRFDRLDLLPEGQDMVAGIDMTGGFYRLFQTSAPFPGCAFLLCLRGSCRVKIHLTCYDLKEGSLAIIFPQKSMQRFHQRFLHTASVLPMQSS